MICPDAEDQRVEWAFLISDQLAKIGIGTRLFEVTTWENIAPRTWSYPFLDYDYIPTYWEGGYDVLFLGRTSKIDWDPSGQFDTTSCCGYSENFYQYINPTYDSVLDSYLTSSDLYSLMTNGHMLQAILYEDLPSISIVYPTHLFLLRDDISSFDSTLTVQRESRCEYWEKSSSEHIVYALPYQLQGFNNFKAVSDIDELWTNAVYGSLFKRNPVSYEWEESIASNYSIEHDYSSLNITVDIVEVSILC